MALPLTRYPALALETAGRPATRWRGSWPAFSLRHRRASRWLGEAARSLSYRSSFLHTCPGEGVIPRCAEEGGGEAGDGGLVPGGGWRFSISVTFKAMRNVYILTEGGRVVAEGGNGGATGGMPILRSRFVQACDGYAWPRRSRDGALRCSHMVAAFNAGGRNARATRWSRDEVVPRNGEAGCVRNGFPATNKVQSYVHAGKEKCMLRAAAGCKAEGDSEGIDWDGGWGSGCGMPGESPHASGHVS